MSRLDIANVGVVFGHGAGRTVAVEGVDLVVPPGKVVGLVGESGSGKSTLAKAVVGLVPLATGSVLLEGRDALSPPNGPRPIQMVFQDPYSSLDPRMTIGESVRESMVGVRGRAEKDARVARSLELVGISAARASQLPRTLSGGQRQRVALARALAASPKVVLADEITSALDVSVQGAVLNVLRETQRKLGFSMLFISHDFAVVRYVSDSVAVMHQGRVVEVAETEQLLFDPQHPYTRALLSSVPRLGSRGREAPGVCANDEQPSPESVEPQDVPS